MQFTPGYFEQFEHVRVIIGMVLGISVSRLVMGMAQFLQHPKRKKIYLVHLGWVLYLFLTITHFWWYEFGLVKIRGWSFGLYFFLISYACLYVFISSLLFPASMDEYDGYEDYFQSRRRMFYIMFSILALADLVDTAIKGSAHFMGLGLEYPLHQAALILLSVVAIFVPSKIWQGVFVSTALLYKSLWIFRLYGELG